MIRVLEPRPVCQELPDAIDGAPTPAPGSWLALGLAPSPGRDPKLLCEPLWGEEQIQSVRARMKANGGQSGPGAKFRNIDRERLLLAVTARVQLRFRDERDGARATARSFATSTPLRINELATADAGRSRG